MPTISSASGVSRKLPLSTTRAAIVRPLEATWLPRQLTPSHAGDLRTAALAYVDAAWIAQEQKNTKQVWELGHRAEMLADSPLLASADRAAILKRISRTPAPMQVVMGAGTEP